MQRTLTNRSGSDKARGVVIDLKKKKVHPVRGEEAGTVRGFSRSVTISLCVRVEQRPGHDPHLTV